QLFVDLAWTQLNPFLRDVHGGRAIVWPHLEAVTDPLDRTGAAALCQARGCRQERHQQERAPMDPSLSARLLLHGTYCFVKIRIPGSIELSGATATPSSVSPDHPLSHSWPRRGCHSGPANGSQV